ncbi:MAG: hypothetical protein EOO40_00920 [Deltaproteobacteria bacterium]|nr:MAG: hypothetical protein EOO40_00920 [Deltaproteobacteria bacterium]
MALLTVPLSQDLPYYTFATALDGITYNLQVAYNVRSDRWYLDIADVIGAPLVTGIALLVNRDLLQPYRAYPVPAGYLVVIDNTGNDNQPGKTAFLTTHTLYYLEATS